MTERINFISFKPASFLANASVDATVKKRFKKTALNLLLITRQIKNKNIKIPKVLERCILSFIAQEETKTCQEISRIYENNFELSIEIGEFYRSKKK